LKNNLLHFYFFLASEEITVESVKNAVKYAKEVVSSVDMNSLSQKDVDNTKNASNYLSTAVDGVEASQGDSDFIDRLQNDPGKKIVFSLFNYSYLFNI